MTRPQPFAGQSKPQLSDADVFRILADHAARLAALEAARLHPVIAALQTAFDRGQCFTAAEALARSAKAKAEAEDLGQMVSGLPAVLQREGVTTAKQLGELLAKHGGTRSGRHNGSGLWSV